MDECPVKISTLADNYNIASSEYAPIFRKLIVLHAMDNAKLWQAIGAKFPQYQILPDTNWVSYIKSNLLSSVYTVSKSASILPTSEEDREYIEHINIALDYIWESCGIGDYQMQAGSYAALFNVGVTQVGWDAAAKIGKSSYTGAPAIKNINPLNFMRDPYAESLDSASYCMHWEDYHKSIILSDSRYKEAFEEHLKKSDISNITFDPSTPINFRAKSGEATGYYKVIVHYVRYYDAKAKEVKIAEVHTLNNETILYCKPEIKPNRFPFVELFCNLPEGDVIGTSEPAKIMCNNIAYNLMGSMMMTAEYKNQRPPKFINSSSGLNINTFTKYGNDADHTFVVNGDASKAVHYHTFPQPSSMAPSLQSNLVRDVQTISGVDGRYTGRDTGSVITTGGVEDMLSRVTLIDAPKIRNYERYTKELTKLILANFVEYGLKRTYMKKTTTGAFESFEVDYKELSNPGLYNYAINISSELPKNKQRVASMANMLMEKQMQYGLGGSNVELITPEEWLELQDLPNKEYMLKRMGLQRLSDTSAEVAETLFSFANLVKAGAGPDDAIAAVAKNLAATRQGNPPPVEIPPMEAVPEDPVGQLYNQQLAQPMGGEIPVM